MSSKQQQLDTLLGPEVESLGFEYVGSQFLQEGRSSLLRILIDTPKGINIDDCSLVTRHINSILDVEDPIKGAYRLEVSSPGLSRPLLKPAHYQRFVNHQVKIRLYVAHDGRRQIIGMLEQANETGITLKVGDEVITLEYSDIEKGNLEPDFSALLK
jgi:ribosome maturation factor RimP